MTKNKETAAKIEATLKAGKVNVEMVRVLGAFVHIDTFAKYGDTVKMVMGDLGAALVMERDGMGLDGKVGYRLVFQF